MIKVAILGYGGRGRMYAHKCINRNDKFQIIAVIDISQEKLLLAQNDLGLDNNQLFNNLDDFLKEEKVADYIFICTQDKEHYEHSIKSINKGYNLLLEKPIACNMEHCLKIEKLAHEKGVKVDVCHVLRYSKYYEKIKEIIDSGILGKIISIEQVENVAYWHQAHSFIRGDWRREDESNPMILAKCCHDLDIAVYLADSKCSSVTSVGKCNYFTKDNAPEGATEYCLGGCSVKKNCPYDAEKLYINGITYIPFVKNLKHVPSFIYKHIWPHSRLMKDSTVTIPKLYDALRNTRYGKCVFLSDNDVVDYQSTTMVFENGITSTLIMTAFNAGKSYRETRIRGVVGELICNMGENKMHLKMFAKKPKKIRLGLNFDAHGGGDGNMINKLAEGKLKTDISMSIESHLIGFVAEKSRKAGGKLELIKDYRNK